MIENLKDLWIEAFKETTMQYVNDTHKLQSRSCAKCLLANKIRVEFNPDRRKTKCDFCIEQKHANRGFAFPCMGRFCEPFYSNLLKVENPKAFPEMKEKVVAYHYKMVQVLKLFRNELFYTHLELIQSLAVEIDRNVFFMKIEKVDKILNSDFQNPQSSIYGK